MSTASAQFIVSSCVGAGLRLRVMIRNTPRGSTSGVDAAPPALLADVRVFRGGSLVYEKQDFARVLADGFAEISAATCPALADTDADSLLVVRTRRDGETGYFPQEHQLIYDTPNGAYTSLIYDQIPIPPRGKPTNPIVLLAPKVWVGKGVNTFVAFCNATESPDVVAQERPMDVTFLDEEGTTILRRSYTLRTNASFVLDAGRELAETGWSRGERRFVNMVARGGASNFAIFTIVQDTATGHCALEHSLSPHYYVSGPLGRVRSEALVL